MIFRPSSFVTLISLLALGLLTSCGESDSARVARLEMAMENAKSALKGGGGAPDEAQMQNQLSPDEQAAEDTSRKLILLCAADLGDPFQQLQADLMRAAVRTLDGYRFKVLDAAGDVGKQLDVLGEAQSLQPVWLLVHPVEERLSAALLENSLRQGVRIVALDQRVPDSSCEAAVFSDQAKIGRMAGEVVLAALKRKATDEKKAQVTGRVVQIRGRDDASASKARAEAFAAVLRAEPGIIIVHDAPGDWTVEGGKARAQDAVKLQKSFDVIFAHNDAMARGASEVLTAAQQRENVLIVGVDGIAGKNGGQDLIRRGVIDATIWQPMPLEIAFSWIQKSINDANFKPERRHEREPVALTPKNIDEVGRKAAK